MVLITWEDQPMCKMIIWNIDLIMPIKKMFQLLDDTDSAQIERKNSNWGHRQGYVNAEIN